MKKIMFIFITIIMALSFCGFALGYDNEKKDIIYYEDRVVYTGDTLWHIDSEYAGDKTDIRDYIYEIKNLNNLKSDKLIEGKRLIIPVYK